MALVLAVAAFLLGACLFVIVRLRSRLRAAESAVARYRLVLDHLPAGLILLDRSLRTQLAAGRGLDSLGLEAGKLAGQRLRDSLSFEAGSIIDPALRAALEGKSTRLGLATGGRDHALQVVPVPGRQGSPRGVILALQDVTEGRRKERGLSELARRDDLTGLLNRRALEQELERLLSDPRPEGPCGVVLLVDLDGFKSVNDTLGHAAGDELLRRVAMALQSSVRRTDVVARVGGDEFAVLLIGMTGSEADRIADKVEAAVATVWPPGLRGGASVGIAVAGGSQLTPTAVLAAADRAMYAAKRAGRLRAAS
ncbi:MAG: hypothetical protein C5B48_15060 [Candidatus Rokuibacteriota bacterium]|nr:MAG: hypothetical protein C5B48_15060 [Candidatus Rokubacteria bacterium]